jgi:hypothetical protein
MHARHAKGYSNETGVILMIILHFFNHLLLLPIKSFHCCVHALLGKTKSLASFLSQTT